MERNEPVRVSDSVTLAVAKSIFKNARRLMPCLVSNSLRRAISASELSSRAIASSAVFLKYGAATARERSVASRFTQPG